MTGVKRVEKGRGSSEPRINTSGAMILTVHPLSRKRIKFNLNFRDLEVRDNGIFIQVLISKQLSL